MLNCQVILILMAASLRPRINTCSCSFLFIFQIDPALLRVVAQVPAFDHCQFDALSSMPEGKRQAFSSALFAMDYGDAADRPVMQAEGITQKYVPGLHDLRQPRG